MLTEDERREIEEAVRHYSYRRAGCVEALKIVQRHRRWVPDEQVADVALMLDMAQDELDAVATFYPFVFRRPVGRHVILVCDSVTCWIMGYEEVVEAIGKLLGISWGETTPDERFTLLPVSCIGECARAPAIRIDDDTYGDVKADDVEKLLERYK